MTSSLVLAQTLSNFSNNSDDHEETTSNDDAFEDKPFVDESNLPSGYIHDSNAPA